MKGPSENGPGGAMQGLACAAGPACASLLLALLSLCLGLPGCGAPAGRPVSAATDRAAAAARGFEARPVPEPGAAPGERYAVCIGISSYANLPDLRFAHRDAEAVYRFLLSEAGGYAPDHCVLLCDGNAPDGRVLRTSVESLLTTWMARVRPEDRVFIFYSGHGIPQGRDGAFLAAWDTDPDDLYPTAIPMERIGEYLQEQIAARRVVVALDTCFSGAWGGKSFLPQGQRAGAFDARAIERAARGEGRVILTASTGRQAAHEVEDLEHGIFTWCLLRGLRGAADVDQDRRVTLSELWLHLQRTVPAEAGRRGLRQTPVLWGRQAGDMVLARPRPASLSLQAGDPETARALALVLEGIRLKEAGFYEKAIDRFRAARPGVPVDQRSSLEALLRACRKAVLDEDAAAGPATGRPRTEAAAGDVPSPAGVSWSVDLDQGRRAEEKGLWEAAVAFYNAALAAAPEERKGAVRARLAACRRELRAASLYREMRLAFEAAEGNPTRAGYAAVLEKAAALEALGKGDGYREFAVMKHRAEEELTGDESRRLFALAVHARDAGRWREAVSWFEKARAGAGGRYPEEIEKNLGYCRVALEKAVKKQAAAAKAALAEGRFEEALAACKAWRNLDPGSGEEQGVRFRILVEGAKALFNEGRFTACRARAEAALSLRPEDEEMKLLLARAREEDQPRAARAAWTRALEAEAAGDWPGAVEALRAGLEAPAGEGFNAHYRALALQRIEGDRSQAYAYQCRRMERFMERGEYARALEALRAARAFRPPGGEDALAELEGELARKAEALEKQCWEAARAAERAAGSGTAEAKDRAVKALEDYLARFPEGRWAEAARSALRRLEREARGAPAVPGFTFLRLETFSCGGAAHTVAVYRHDRSGLEFVLLPGGTFLMGSSPREEGRSRSEGFRRSVTVSPFLICRTECTRRAWLRVLGGEALKGTEGDLPVSRVSWDESKEWCRRAGLRLPMEAEWEYACRAGTDTAWCFGDSAADLGTYAWYDGNARGGPHPAGRKKPNAFGLFDMHGNLWEWCEDPYRPPGAPAAPPGARPNRVTRGGGWNFPARDCRSAHRGGDPPNLRNGVLGFRPACSLPEDLR